MLALRGSLIQNCALQKKAERVERANISPHPDPNRHWINDRVQKMRTGQRRGAHLNLACLEQRPKRVFWRQRTRRLFDSAVCPHSRQDRVAVPLRLAELRVRSLHALLWWAVRAEPRVALWEAQPSFSKVRLKMQP